MISIDFRYRGLLRSPLLVAVAIVAVGIAYGVALGLSVSPLVLIAAPVAVALFAITWWRPEFAAAVLVVVDWGYLTNIAIYYHGTPSISKILIGLLLVMLLLRRFVFRSQKLLGDAIIWWVLAYLLVASFGLLYASESDRTLRMVEELAKQVIVFVLIINLLSTARSFRFMLWMLLAVGALLGTLTVIQEATHTYNNNFGGLALMEVADIAEGLKDRPRAGGPTGSPNSYGQQLIVLVPIGLWAALNGRGIGQRMFGGYAAVACLAGIGLSFSRTAYIATAVVLALYALHIRLNLRYLLLVLPLAALMLAVAPPELSARFSTLRDLLPSEESQGIRSDFSYQRRSVEMLMAAYMFVDHPVLGVGGNNYPALYPRYIRETGSPVPDEERTPHSYYLEIAAEHGLVGLIPWLGILLIAGLRLRSARRDFASVGNMEMAELAVALGIGYLGYLTTAVFIHGAYPFFLWLQLGWAVALAALARRAAVASPGASVNPA